MDLPPAWLSREQSDLSGLKLGSLLASWRLLASWTSLPRLIILRTIWSDWTQSRLSPLALRNMSLECIVVSPMNPGCLLFIFYRKDSSTYVYVHTFVPCIVYRTLFQVFASYLFGNRLCLIITVIVHYHYTGNVFQIFWIPKTTTSYQLNKHHTLQDSCLILT